MSETEIKKIPKCVRGQAGQKVTITVATLLALYNENFELAEEDAKTEIDNSVKTWAVTRAKEMDWVTIAVNDTGLVLSSDRQADTTKTGTRNSSGASSKAEVMGRLSGRMNG